MLPAIGSVSALAKQGRVGVVVSAQPIGEPENGRQLVALRIRDGEQTQNARSRKTENLAPARTADPTHAQPSEGRSSSTSAARMLNELSPAEKAAVSRLQQRDQQVRQEEKAHAAVAGDLAGPINYVYQRGPDGRQYAVGGSVGIQTSAASGDPVEAKRQAGRLAAAANAATNPSAQDYAAARQAYALGGQLKALTELNDREAGLSLLL
jgi:hypothetical protein